MNTKETWNGERMETEVSGEAVTEHLHRYAVAMDLAEGKKLLDIACGEGYGASLLGKKATHVTAIDIDEGTIQKASTKYRADNILFKTGSIHQINEPDGNFDMITCFETLEHLDDHDRVISELRRVLRPGGLLLISTPDKANYSERTGHNNPWHRKELYRNEFKTLLTRYFPYVELYGQVFFSGSAILPESPGPAGNLYKGDFTKINSSNYLDEAMYLLAIASSEKGLQPVSSLFDTGKTIKEIKDDQTRLLKRTFSYRTGHILLYPFKLIRSLFRK